MKKKFSKFLGVGLALVLVCSFSLVTAVPVAAVEPPAVPDRTTAITLTADRLVALQSTETLGLLEPPDFGWDWIVTGLAGHSADPSSSNLYGVTALGLIDAYQVTKTQSYLDAAGHTAEHITAGSVEGFWDDYGYGQDYWFLMAYALEAGDTTYSDYAKAAWAFQKVAEAHYASAEAWWTWAITGGGGRPAGIVAWQGSACGLAALAMGDTLWADNMATVVSTHLPDIAVDDIYRFIGWGKALEFLNAVDPTLYATEIDTLITNLTTSQNADGSWGTGQNTEGYAQDIAYAIMGLAAVGGVDAIAVARDGADWLITNQGYDTIEGGWNNSSNNIEYSETDSEALQALASVPPLKLELDRDWYGTDDTVFVTVEDAAANNPVRTDDIVVAAVSTTDTSGITVTLNETSTDTGVFEGSFPLVPSPVPPEPTPEEVMVNDGDLITVTYLGATDTATVDDTLPEISNVSPVNGAIVPDTTPLISATLADVGSGINEDTIVMTVGGVDVSADVDYDDVTGVASYTPDALAEGEHNVTVDVDDVVGNAAAQVSWSFTVDTEKPTVTVALGPDPPPYTAVGTITFTLTFSEPMDTSITPDTTFGLPPDLLDTHGVDGAWTVDSQTEWVGTFVIDGAWVIGDDGEQTLWITDAEDLAGNMMVGDKSFTFVIDLHAPTAPSYMHLYVDENPPGTADTVEGEEDAVEPNALVEVWDHPDLRGEDNLIGFIDAAAFGDFDHISILDNQYGEVWVTAADDVGNRSGPTLLLNDIEKPTVSGPSWTVDEGQPPWVLEGQEIVVTFTGETSCTGTFTIRKGIGGTAIIIVSDQPMIEVDGTYTGSYTVLLDDDVDGAGVAHKLVDDVGNWNGASPMSGNINIDTTVPTIAQLTPADGAFVDTATPEVSAILDDNLSGIDPESIVMEIDSVGVTVGYADGVVSYTPDSDLAEGSHAVTLDVSDVAGNPATQASWSFTVDTIDPVITITQMTTPTDVDLQEIKGTFTELNLYKIVLTFNGHSQVVNISEQNWNVPTLVYLQGGDNLIVATITDLAGNSASAEVTINLDTQAPVVTVTTPNGGESLLGGNMYNITWTALDANFITSPITIKYSVDSGKSWNDVATGEPNDGGYLWAVPKLDSSNCLVRVTGTDLLGHSGSDVSDAAFTITTSAPDTTAPAVTVNSPDGGENWPGGSTQTITWTVTDDKTPSGDLVVDLYYSSDGGTIWTSIASIVDNDGAYSWGVPNNVDSSQCLVKVEAKDADENIASDASDAVFTISPEAVEPEEVTIIDLEAGWNLVSLMLIPTSSNITNVLGGIDVVSVWAYDASIENSAERWSWYTPDTPGGLETMVDGKGYWINMSEPAPLTIEGQELPVPPDFTMPAYSVVEGWNLIGFKSITPRAVDSYLLAIDGKYTLVRGYETKYFTVGTGENLDPGYGYWISVTEPGTIYP